jgi:hypothetical protein
MSQFNIRDFGKLCSEMAFYLHHKIPDEVCLNLYDFWFASQTEDYFTKYSKQFKHQNYQIMEYFSHTMKNRPKEMGDPEFDSVRKFSISLLEFEKYFQQLMLSQQNPVPVQPTPAVQPTVRAQPVPRPMYHPVAPVVRPPPGGPQDMNPGGRVPVNQQEQAARGWEIVRRNFAPQGHVHPQHAQGAGHGQAYMRPAHPAYVQPHMYASDPRYGQPVVPPPHNHNQDQRNPAKPNQWQKMQQAAGGGQYYAGNGAWRILAGRLDENNEKDTTDHDQEDKNNAQHHEDKESSATTLRALLTQLQEL